MPVINSQSQSWADHYINLVQTKEKTRSKLIQEVTDWVESEIRRIPKESQEIRNEVYRSCISKSITEHQANRAKKNRLIALARLKLRNRKNTRQKVRNSNKFLLNMH